MIIDIREEVNEEVEGIRFDDSGDLIVRRGKAVGIVGVEGEDCPICTIEDIDNFIKALKKAKELWG